MLQLAPTGASTLVMACVTLHNWMRIRYSRLQNQALDHDGEEPNIIRGAWRADCVLEDVQSMTGPTQASMEAKRQRVYLKHYYSNIGAVPWQRDMI